LATVSGRRRSGCPQDCPHAAGRLKHDVRMRRRDKRAAAREEDRTAGDELRSAMRRAIHEVLEDNAPGRAEVAEHEWSGDPGRALSFEVTPKNPEAAEFELIVSDIDTVVCIGDQACRIEIDRETARRPETLVYVRELFRAVVLGRYREQLARRGRVWRRVEAVVTLDDREVRMSTSKPWYLGEFETAEFAPY
jgi:hypothetical protein